MRRHTLGWRPLFVNFAKRNAPQIRRLEFRKDHLKIEQGRCQSIFNRLYTESIKLLIGFIVIMLFGLFLNDEPNFAIILFAFLLPILVTLWLGVFNTGASKIIDHGLNISNTHITYINFGKKRTIALHDYNGYEITKGWLKQIIICSKENQNIVFDYTNCIN